MSNIRYITMHYSATYDDQDVREPEIRQWHLARGFSDTGYHYVGPLDGSLEVGRAPETRTGAGVGGHNTGNIHICMVGGLKRSSGGNVGHDTRTREQIDTQIKLTRELLGRHPQAKVKGHKDFKATQCPGYDVVSWWGSVNGQSIKPVAQDTSLPTYSYAMVKRGSRGNAVEVLQSALKVIGYRVGVVDGDFGPMTDAAVRAFQKDAKVNVDGAVGPVTWAELFKAK